MSLINKEDLMQMLGITDMGCEKCGWYSIAARRCKRGSDFEDACFAIDNAPEVNPGPKWVPVTERLLENKQEVLVTEYEETDIGRRFEGRWLDRYGDKMKDVTAWMPLPEPWKEGEANGN